MSDITALVSNREITTPGMKTAGYSARLKIGSFEISVQASEFHYCRPRGNYPAEQYTHMEIAIFDCNDEWVRPWELYGFPRRLAELFECCPPVDSEEEVWMECPVAASVSIADIREIITALEHITGKALK